MKTDPGWQYPTNSKPPGGAPKPAPQRPIGKGPGWAVKRGPGRDPAPAAPQPKDKGR